MIEIFCFIAGLLTGVSFMPVLRIFSEAYNEALAEIKEEKEALKK